MSATSRYEAVFRYIFVENYQKIFASLRSALLFLILLPKLLNLNMMPHFCRKIRPKIAMFTKNTCVFGHVHFLIKISMKTMVASEIYQYMNKNIYVSDEMSK